MELDRVQCTLDRTISTMILDDLCSRFIINVPEEERKDLIRLCFQIELAHWFYLDFYCKTAKKTIGIKEFAQNIFQHIPSLQPFSYNVDRIIDEWKEYKYLVPTFGAILLDEDLSNVLLVQSYYSRSSWGFPKGKVNKDEPPWGCAIREVYEETGFNIRELIDPNEYLDARVHEQLVRLYIIPGVSRSAKFQPMTRNEIKAVDWFPLTDLPATKKDVGYKVKGPSGTDYFYMVGPFIRRLRQWIYDHKAKPLRKPRRARHNSCGDLDNFGHKDYPSLKFLKNIKEIKNKAMTELGELECNHNFKTYKEKYKEEEQRPGSNEGNRRNSSPEDKIIEIYTPESPKKLYNYNTDTFISQSSSQNKMRIKRKHSETFDTNGGNNTILKENCVNRNGEETTIGNLFYVNNRRHSSSDNRDTYRPKSVELSPLMITDNQTNHSDNQIFVKSEPRKMCVCGKLPCKHTKLLKRNKRKISNTNNIIGAVEILKNDSENQEENGEDKIPISAIISNSGNKSKLNSYTENRTGNSNKVPITFNEISLSESIKRYGISHWCNFRFDVSSILKCIEEIK